jgi:DNA-binding IclR family transcriptional regulator
MSTPEILEESDRAGVRTLSSATRAFSLIDAIAASPRPIRPPALSATLGWSRATLHQHLVTAVNAGWIEQTESGAYRLSMRVASIGRAAMEQAGLGRRVLPMMRELSDELREATFLAVLSGDSADITERVEPRRLIRADFNGDSRWPLNISASGKIFCAFMDAANLADLESRGVALPSSAEIARVRVNGYAVSTTTDEDDETIAIAVAITDDRGECLAALGILAPSERVELDAVVTSLRATAERIHRTLHGARS